jgi:hypothetical protein
MSSLFSFSDQGSENKCSQRWTNDTPWMSFYPNGTDVVLKMSFIPFRKWYLLTKEKHLGSHGQKKIWPEQSLQYRTRKWVS